MLYTPDIEIVLERLLKLQEAREAKGRPLSQSDIAQGLGCSPAGISNFVNRKEVGDVAKLAQAIKAYVEREELKDEAGLLKIPFAETRQARKLIDAYTFAIQYGRIVAVLGGSGFGKTRTIAELQKRDRTLIVMTAWSQLGASGVLQELCESIRVSDRGLLRALMKRLKHKLHDSGRCLIVDDAHTLSFKALDVLRYIYDQTGIGMMLVGIPALRRHLIGTSEETEQLASRVSGRVFEMPDLNHDDVSRILAAAMGERQADEALKLLGRDEQLMSSARRLGNVLEVAGALASKAHATLAIEHVAKAIKVAA